MRISRIVGSVVLLMLAFATALLLCEVAARELDGQPLTVLRIPPTKYKPSTVRHLDPTVGGSPLPPDIDPSWIDVSPPVRTRPAVEPKLAALAQEALRLGSGPVDVFRIWNRLFVEQIGCKSGK